MTIGSDNRRGGERISVEMWVQETRGRDIYFMRACNVSRSGLFLEGAVPHALGSTVTLEFILPRQARPLRVRAHIVTHSNVGGELGMGVEFVEPDAVTREALALFAEHT